MAAGTEKRDNNVRKIQQESRRRQRLGDTNGGSTKFGSGGGGGAHRGAFLTVVYDQRNDSLGEKREKARSPRVTFHL